MWNIHMNKLHMKYVRWGEGFQIMNDSRSPPKYSWCILNEDHVKYSIEGYHLNPCRTCDWNPSDPSPRINLVINPSFQIICFSTQYVFKRQTLLQILNISFSLYIFIFHVDMSAISTNFPCNQIDVYNSRHWMECFVRWNFSSEGIIFIIIIIIFYNYVLEIS